MWLTLSNSMHSLANLNNAYRKEKEKMNTSIRAEKKKYKKQEADYRNIVGNTCIADVYSYLADLHGKGLFKDI